MIYCVGDSHVEVFYCVNNSQLCSQKFEIYHMGPFLAYTVGDRGHENYQKTMKQISSFTLGSEILLSFGEIDCRAHILRQSEKRSVSVLSVVEEVVHIYENIIRDVSDKGYKVIVWCPIATANVDCFEWNDKAEFPRYGKAVVRNEITKHFCDCLLYSFKGHHNIHVISILNHLLNENMTSKSEYYKKDGVHLAEAAVPVIISEIEKQYSSI